MLYDFEFAMAFFPTKGANSYQIFPLFSDAVAIPECNCDVKVITIYFTGYFPVILQATLPPKN